MNLLSFKWKRLFMYFDYIVTMVFCILLVRPICAVIQNLMNRNATTALLELPVGVTYMIIPFAFVLMVVRLIEECIRLSKENEHSLGKSKPSLDLDKCEAEYRQWLQANQKNGNGEGGLL